MKGVRRIPLIGDWEPITRRIRQGREPDHQTGEPDTEASGDDLG